MIQLSVKDIQQFNESWIKSKFSIESDLEIIAILSV